MTDLFTHLAQGQAEGHAVQPRLRTRFEDPAYNSVEEGPGVETATDTGAAEAAPRPVDERNRREGLDPGATRDDLTVTELRTIRMVTPLNDTKTTPRADGLPALLDVAVEFTPPEQTGGVVKVDAVPAVAQRPPATESKTIDEGAGIAPRGESTALPAASQQVALSGAMPQIQPTRSIAEPLPSFAGRASVIEVHIGRIELRQAAPPVQETPVARPRFEPPLSLSDYLARRNGGGE